MRELIDGGTELVGATAGAAIAFLGGPGAELAGPAAGVMVRRAFWAVGIDVYERHFAPRQRVRVGAAYAEAAIVVRDRIQAGEVPRTDGFFETDASGVTPAAELLEGMLLAAADSYEERKVPFLGRLYASLVFDAAVTRAHANYLIGLAQGVTFRQLALMAVLLDGDVGAMAARAAREDPPKQVMFNEDLGIEVDELERMGLVGRGTPGGTPRRSGMTFVDASGTVVGSLTLTGPGKRLYELMGLGEIPSEVREREVLGELVVVGRADSS